MEIFNWLKTRSGLGIFIVLFTVYSAGFSIDLTSNGGYNLVIAIEESTVAPADVGEYKYVQNIQTSLQVFSTQLWRATKNQFFINSVEVLIPSNWTIATSELSASHSFQNADFRVSPNITYPHAENTNLCGLPGKFIQLPLSFFKNANSNDFGPIWKTLMVLFARFRFGVWEEHGFVGDENFPYFQQNLVSKAWEVTGCNNEPIVGKLLNAVDREECTVDWSSSADDMNSCRFVPDRVKNKATSSLMNLQFMDSVVEFCDEATHNSAAENKQNMFCDHKSIMEVIRSTPDFKAVTNPVTQVPAIQFKVAKQTGKPIFYLLLDRGLIQGSLDIARLLPQHLARLFGHTNRRMNIAAIGSYPSDRNGSFIKEEVGWSAIGQNLDAFLMAVGELKVNGPLNRDFSRAIIEVADIIKKRNPPHGAVVLVVKYGTDLNNLKNTAPEAEVITRLNEQNIILHSIELANLGETPKAHLANVARATDGTYTTLSVLGEAPNAINNVMNQVHTYLQADYPDLKQNRRTIVKNAVTSSVIGLQVPVPDEIQSKLEVFYTSETLYTQLNFKVNVNSYRFSRTGDWQVATNMSKYTYRFTFDASHLVANNIKNIIIQTESCDAGVNCDEKGTVIARADINSTSAVSNNLDIEVWVSANVVDLSFGTPLGLFVKVTKYGVPVRNAGVMAKIINTETSVTESESLLDNGGTPDVLENDGIYSVSIAPRTDGSYKIAVTISNSLRLIKDAPTTLRESSLGRLLPIDQGTAAGCEILGDCPIESIIGSFVEVVDVPSVVTFTESAKYQPAPVKTLVFFFQNLRMLKWVSPKIPGLPDVSAESYEIRKASTRQQLQDDFDNCDNVTLSIFPRPSRPGTVESVILPLEIYTTFYGIKAVYKGQKSQYSNIVRFQTGIDAPIDPTTPTTVGTGPTTSITGSSTTGSGETTSQGSTVPGQTTPQGSTVPGETTPVGSTVSGETTPQGSTVSGETTPVRSTVSGETTPQGSTVSGETTPNPTGSTDPSSSTERASAITAKPELHLLLAFLGGFYVYMKMY